MASPDLLLRPFLGASALCSETHAPLPAAERNTGVASCSGDGVIPNPQLPSPTETDPVGAPPTSPEVGIAQSNRGPPFGREAPPRMPPHYPYSEVKSTDFYFPQPRSEHRGETPQPRGGHREDSPQSCGGRRDCPSRSPSSHSWPGSCSQRWSAWGGYGKDRQGKNSEK